MSRRDETVSGGRAVPVLAPGAAALGFVFPHEHFAVDNRAHLITETALGRAAPPHTFHPGTVATGAALGRREYRLGRRCDDIGGAQPLPGARGGMIVGLIAAELAVRTAALDPCSMAASGMGVA